MQQFIEPTLEDGPRRSGRTTRIINDAIEHLMQHGYAWVTDHHDSSRSQRDAAQRLVKRKQIEFPYIRLVAYDVIRHNGHLGQDLGTVFFFADYNPAKQLHEPKQGLLSVFNNYLMDIRMYDKVHLKNHRAY